MNFNGNIYILGLLSVTEEPDDEQAQWIRSRYNPNNMLLIPSQIKFIRSHDFIAFEKTLLFFRYG